jgi:hypothetical protein
MKAELLAEFSDKEKLEVIEILQKANIPDDDPFLAILFLWRKSNLQHEEQLGNLIKGTNAEFAKIQSVPEDIKKAVAESAQHTLNVAEAVAVVENCSEKLTSQTVEIANVRLEAHWIAIIHSMMVFFLVSVGFFLGSIFSKERLQEMIVFGDKGFPLWKNLLYLVALTPSVSIFSLILACAFFLQAKIRKEMGNDNRAYLITIGVSLVIFGLWSVYGLNPFFFAK